MKSQRQGHEKRSVIAASTHLAKRKCISITNSISLGTSVYVAIVSLATILFTSTSDMDTVLSAPTLYMRWTASANLDS